MRSASSSAWSSIKATSLATSTGTPFSRWTVASEATGRAWILARATLRRQRSIPVGHGNVGVPASTALAADKRPPPSFGGGRLLVYVSEPITFL